MVFPRTVHVIPVKSADDMRASVIAEIPANDAVIMAAAVADFRPKKASYEKLKKSDMETVFELERNPDILAELGQRKSHYALVGFAAETADLEQEGLRKLNEKNADIIVANKIGSDGAGFGDSMSRAVILETEGKTADFDEIAKSELASILLDKLKKYLKDKKRG
jgi:phosphopantothenoylcysteine decarboxylase/phosphopantothenate--cysteine ligase